jgi:epoxyqueuosine reductase QueG
MQAELAKLLATFEEESALSGLRGILGLTPFRPVFEALMPVQRRLLAELCGKMLDELKEGGSFISLAYAYPAGVVDGIAVEVDEGYDIDRWNVYARWYGHLNEALNSTAERIAEEVDGFPLPATITWNTDVDHVKEYYSIAVSHRVAAERAGIGWRGKNELLVNPRYGCAIRLTSVLTPLGLPSTEVGYDGCGDCRSCLAACTFLAQKDALPDYREQCRRYINSLGLEAEVCGKCIKACAGSPGLAREIEKASSEKTLYYTHSP